MPTFISSGFPLPIHKYSFISSEKPSLLAAFRLWGLKGQENDLVFAMHLVITYAIYIYIDVYVGLSTRKQGWSYQEFSLLYANFSSRGFYKRDSYYCSRLCSRHGNLECLYSTLFLYFPVVFPYTLLAKVDTGIIYIQLAEGELITQSIIPMLRAFAYFLPLYATALFSFLFLLFFRQ